MSDEPTKTQKVFYVIFIQAVCIIGFGWLILQYLSCFDVTIFGWRVPTSDPNFRVP